MPHLDIIRHIADLDIGEKNLTNLNVAFVSGAEELIVPVPVIDKWGFPQSLTVQDQSGSLHYLLALGMF